MTGTSYSSARWHVLWRHAAAPLCTALIAAAMLFIAPRAANAEDLSTQSQFFDGCGTVIMDELYYCYLFQADSDGKIYAVPGLDSYSYNVGDRLHIEGITEPAVSFCTLDAHFIEATITYCDEGCLGDIDGDGVVDVFDLLALLSQWGPCGYNCAADLNEDG